MNIEIINDEYGVAPSINCVILTDNALRIPITIIKVIRTNFNCKDIRK